MKSSSAPYISTTNACKLCKPLGACLAFRGIEGAIPFLHGSQGCATYMRRYIISHFREPMDIASSSLGEKQAVYGGEANLKQGLRNVVSKYGARLIGIATTCLTETIGDDVPMILRSFLQEPNGEDSGDELPRVVHVSTPSYSGTHMEGFHAAVRAVVDQMAVPAERPCLEARLNILPGFVSPADIRHLKEILEEFGIEAILLPDISETMDGPALEDYQKLPEGGTPIEAIMDMGRSGCTVEFGRTMGERNTAGHLLQERFGVPLHAVGTPIGLRETDRFLRVLECTVDRKTPGRILSERGRLVDSYVDAHKVVFGKKAVVYGEEDLVVALASFLTEIGVKPVLCASGGQSGRLEKSVRAVTGDILPETPRVREGMDFHEIAEEAESLEPDLLIGHSKGYHLARKWKIPLVRVGFPIHDRFGGQRMLHVGYRGTQNLLDHIVNAFIEKKQEDSPIGYGYM
ncbi:MAG: nitrogenase [Syntrophobacteraceae bacterium]|nr:nitrogenase [Syntrophobacteraceae bacterium]